MELTSINQEDLSLNELMQNTQETTQEGQSNLETSEEPSLSFRELVEKMENGEIAKKEGEKEEELTEEEKQAEELKKAEENKIKQEFKNKTQSTKEKLDESTKQAITKLIELGELKPFEDNKYETVNDMQELIRENKNDWKQETYQEVEKEFYSNKSPMWQTLLQYAEDNKNPADVLSLLSDVNEYQAIQSLSLDTPENQEYIIGASLSLQGLSEDIIKSEIEDLKDRNKLEERAKVLKPALEKYNQDLIEQRLQDKQIQEQQDQLFWENHVNNVVREIIEPSDIDGMKLKKEDKQFVAQNLVPDSRTGNLPIFGAINNLLEQGDFKTLAQIILLANDKKKFNSYYSSKVTSTITEDLQRKLRQSKTSETTNVEGIEQSSKQTGLKRSIFGNTFTNNL